MDDEASEQAECVVAQLFSPTGRADPYPLYRRLRQAAPMHRSSARGVWLVSGWYECRAVLRDPRLGRGYPDLQDLIRPGWRSRPALARMESSMLMLDGAAHARLRGLLSRVFTAATVQRMRPAVEAMVAELLVPLAEAGAGDLMAALAFPLPTQAIAELLGVPSGDVAPLRELAAALAGQFEMDAGGALLDAADRAQQAGEAYFADLLEHKRRRPGADLLSDLLAVCDGADRLSAPELTDLALLLFLAGTQTTSNLIGNAMLGLLAHPDQVELLAACPQRYRDLPRELLRHDSPVQLVIRSVLAPIVAPDGSVLEPGESVFVLVGAGNRDPRRFVDPDRLDVTRPDVRELSFGGGAHYCIGAALARLEVEVVFRSLFEGFSGIVTTGPICYRDTLTVRGPLSVPLALTPRGAGRPPPRPYGPRAVRA